MTSTNAIHKNPEGSRAQVQEKLKLFMTDNNFKVLALKGKWGVGKTHLVETFFNEQKQDFYYGSVFGISSIEQLKSQILANKGATGKILQWVNSQSDRVTKTKEVSLPYLPTIAGSAISIGGDLLFNLAFNSINGFICIDDLERKSKLGLDEILGLVENLIQKSNCKVIFIYNEDELIKDEASKKALKEYREKVIDIEVELNPTVEENFSLVFSNNAPDIEIVKNTFILTKTNNIRVLKKTKWNLEKFQPLMQEWHPKTRKAVIEHIITISLAKLDTNFAASILTVLNINNYFLIDLNNTSIVTQKYPELTEEQVKNIRKEVLFLCSLFGSSYYNLSIDRHIADLVNSCLFDQNDFQEKGKLLNEKQRDFEIKEKLTKAYEPYYNSFNDSTDKLLENFNNFLDLYYKEIDFDTFKRLCDFCSLTQIKLDIPTYEQKFFEHIIENDQNLGKLEITNPDLFIKLRRGIEKYPELSKRLDQKILQFNSASRNITDILKSCQSENFISQNDKVFLNNQSINDYYQWLHNGHADLSSMVRFYLGFTTETGSKNLEAAIKKLAEENTLNAVRAEYLFGITSQKISVHDDTSNYDYNQKDGGLSD